MCDFKIESSPLQHSGLIKSLQNFSLAVTKRLSNENVGSSIGSKQNVNLIVLITRNEEILFCFKSLYTHIADTRDKNLVHKNKAAICKFKFNTNTSTKLKKNILNIFTIKSFISCK